MNIHNELILKEAEPVEFPNIVIAHKSHLFNKSKKKEIWVTNDQAIIADYNQNLLDVNLLGLYFVKPGGKEYSRISVPVDSLPIPLSDVNLEESGFVVAFDITQSFYAGILVSSKSGKGRYIIPIDDNSQGYFSFRKDDGGILFGTSLLILLDKDLDKFKGLEKKFYSVSGGTKITLPSNSSYPLSIISYLEEKAPELEKNLETGYFVSGMGRLYLILNNKGEDFSRLVIAGVSRYREQESENGYNQGFLRKSIRLSGTIFLTFSNAKSLRIKEIEREIKKDQYLITKLLVGADDSDPIYYDGALSRKELVNLISKPGVTSPIGLSLIPHIVKGEVCSRGK